jgi:hypothetical protein
MKLVGQRSYPKELLVGSTVYQIKFVRRCPGSSLSVHGICDPSECVIYLRQGQSRAELFSTLIHELLHAFEAEGDFHIQKNHKVGDVTYKLESSIAQFLLSNFIDLR